MMVGDWTMGVETSQPPPVPRLFVVGVRPLLYEVLEGDTRSHARSRKGLQQAASLSAHLQWRALHIAARAIARLDDRETTGVISRPAPSGRMLIPALSCALTRAGAQLSDQ
jgi:hypothetical protein